MLRALTLTRLVALIVIVSLVAWLASVAFAATSPTLGAADSFAVLANTAITNVPTSHISGDVGLMAAGSNYSGLGTTDMVAGTIYAFSAGGPAGSVVNPALLTSAMAANTTAFGALIAPPNDVCTTNYGAVVQDLAGLTLVPGVYCANAFTLSGVLTLDDTGNPNGVWVFRADLSTLITSGGSVARVRFLNGIGSPCNVWWRVASSATLNTGTVFIGNILALTSIQLLTGASLEGRAFAQTGAVTLDQNTITRPICALAVPGITSQIHDANHAVVTSAPIGTIVHDMATVTGTLGITPTGIVSFTVYADQICSVGGTFAGAVPLVAGVAHPSNTATVTSAGLSYRAHYNGDANYNAADGPCEALAIPTAVELLYFRADQLSGRQVRLEWATALEVDNFGFNLYRANVDDLGHTSLIHFEPAVTQGGGSGATYVYIDTAPYTGPWWYWLADVDTQGRETLHALTNVTVQSNPSLYRIHLPLVVN